MTVYSNCNGTSNSTLPCNQQACCKLLQSRFIFAILLYLPIALTCSWSTWTASTSCSVSCDTGSQQQTRTLTVSSQPGFICTSNETQLQTASCSSKPCPVNCMWYWSQYTPCSQSCGVGLSTRTVVVTQVSNNGGAICPMTYIQSLPCMVSLCSDCSISANGPKCDAKIFW